MFSMTKLRDRSNIILWTLLFFFVASMTIGGLVGGANIITVIQGLFGKVNTNFYVGKVGDENIPISYYLNERQKQLNRFRQQGRNIDARAIQNAGDFAWNTIVDRKIKDAKIEEFNLIVQDDEIFDFLLLSPPISFQDNLKALGLYKDVDDNFMLNEYQDAIRFGTLPDTTQQLLLNWENYLREYLADRKLQNLFNNMASLTDHEVIEEYMKNNLHCSIDIVSIQTNSIDDSLITLNDQDVANQYNLDKDSKYKLEEQVVLEYILIENIDSANLDSSIVIDMQDSLLQLAIDFSSEAGITSFNDALETYDLIVSDTLFITEDFNSPGIPYQMGSIRAANRFAFDNKIGSTSEHIITDNGIAIFHILNKLPKSYKPIFDVENSIKRTLSKDLKIKYSKSILKNLDNATDWNNFSDKHDFIEYNSNVKSTIGGSFNPIGKSNELAGLLLSANIDETSNTLESSTHIFAVKVIEMDTFDESLYAASKDSIRNILLDRKKGQVFNKWLRQEKENLDILDLRHKIF